MSSPPAVMNFSLPDEYATGLGVSHECPSEYKRYLLKDAEVTYIAGKFGEGLLQEVKTAQFVMGRFLFNIQQALNIYPVPSSAMVSLYGTLRGCITCDLQGFGTVTLQKGEYGFYYVPPELKNTAYFKEGLYEGVYFSFAPDYLAEFIAQCPQFQSVYCQQCNAGKVGVVLPTFPIGPDELNILEAIQQCQYTGATRLLFLKARICDLLVQYFSALEISGVGQPGVSVKQDEQIKKVLDYVQKNLHLPISVDGLCEKFKFTRRNFEKRFFTFTGFTPRKYIEYVRLLEAERLLVRTTFSVSEIAYRTGFDADYFTRVFTKKHQYSPLQYRYFQREKDGAGNPC